MKSMDLLEVIGSIRDNYIWEGHRQEATPKKAVPIRRAFLIAAIVAMLLLLVGCAVVYVLGLRELQLGEYVFTKPRYIDAAGNKVGETEVTRDVISLQGIVGSPAFQASQEWFKFEQSYDPDNALLNEADKHPIEVSPEYDAYFVYTQEMVDKVDEITKKYGLKLAGENVCAQDFQTDIFFDSLGIKQLHQRGASVQYGGGYFYSSGNFRMDMNITLEKREVFVSYRYNGKAYFDTVFSSVSSIENCEEWVYPLSDGQKVLIVMDSEYAQVFCDRDNAFIHLHINLIQENEGGTEVRLSKAEIEQIVDHIDFSVTPQKPNIDITKRKLAESFDAYQKEQEAKLETYIDPFKHDYKNYDDVIRFLLENGVDPDAYLYALRDITGDGVEELFLGQGGTFGSIKTMVDGTPTTLWSNGTDQGLELCEGNILRLTNGDSYCFMELDETQFVEFLSLGYDPWEESWYYIVSGNTEMNKISREEFDSMVASYPVIDIGMKPIREYPLK